jgi:hypothetical protein
VLFQPALADKCGLVARCRSLHQTFEFMTDEKVVSFKFKRDPNGHFLGWSPEVFWEKCGVKGFLWG